MYKMHVHVHVVRNNDPLTPNLSQHNDTSEHVN